MKMRILARIQAEGNVYSAQTCWVNDCGQNIKVYGSNREEAFSNLSKQVEQFIETSARNYIDAHSSTSGRINCPQAFILLPIDLWYCKDNRSSCSLQGQIDTSNFENFFNLCTQPEKVRTKIWQTVTNGKYKGFHHLPGRYKCVTCDNGNINFNYHYPWELTHLADHCNVVQIWNDAKRASHLIIDGFRLSVLSSSLCNDCFLKEARRFPEIKLEEYQTIEYEYHRS